jgi:hypothetical protein
MKPRIGARDRLRGPSRLTDVHDKRQRAPQLLTTRSNAPSRKSASVMILSRQTSECRFHRRDREWLHVPASTGMANDRFASDCPLHGLVDGVEST